MTSQRPNDEIANYIATLMNEEQNYHSDLVAKLRTRIGGTKEYEDVVKVLTTVFEAKYELLDKIFKKVQSL